MCHLHSKIIENIKLSKYAPQIVVNVRSGPKLMIKSKQGSSKTNLWNRGLDFLNKNPKHSDKQKTKESITLVLQ